MKEIGISFILTTMNRPEYLKATLVNIRNIRLDFDEVIVVDGGCDIETKSIIDGFQNVVDIFISESDNCEAHALNKGLLVASKEIVKVMTDDDRLICEGIERARNIFVDNPDIDFLQCGGLGEYVDGSGRKSVKLRLNSSVSIKSTNGIKRAGCGLGSFFRRDLIPYLGLYDVSYLAIDHEYLSRAIKYELNVTYLDTKVYIHKEYQHSAQRNRDRCYGDEVKLALAYGPLINISNHDITLGFKWLKKDYIDISMWKSIWQLSWLKRNDFKILLFFLQGLISIIWFGPAMFKKGLSVLKQKLQSITGIRKTWLKRKTGINDNDRWTNELRKYNDLN